jgi:hypothetical protein
MKYEAPEVIDLGNAEGMIFGGCGTVCDNCSDNAYGGGAPEQTPTS